MQNRKILLQELIKKHHLSVGANQTVICLVVDWCRFKEEISWSDVPVSFTGSVDTITFPEVDQSGTLDRKLQWVRHTVLLNDWTLK